MEMHFHPMVGPADMFELYAGDEPVGMVWKANGSWCADRFNTAAPTIREADRVAAATKLILRTGALARC
jgi:hypothetical protein